MYVKSLNTVIVGKMVRSVYLPRLDLHTHRQTLIDTVSSEIHRQVGGGGGGGDAQN